MTNPIFGRPRHWYDSYTDFWTLVDLCGYEWCYIDEMDIEDASKTYIFTGPEAKHEFVDAKARIIYWLLEWYADYVQRDGVSATWVSNRTYADRVNATFVPMGGHPNLGNVKRGDGRYWLAHMSYAGIHRRSLIFGRIAQEAKNWGEHGFQYAPNAWGKERDFNLRNSRAMLHIHQDEQYPAIAPLRAVLAAAYGLALIAENGWSVEPYQDFTHTFKYDYLPRGCMEVLSVKSLNEQGRAFHDYVCNELRFDKVVEANL